MSHFKICSLSRDEKSLTDVTGWNLSPAIFIVDAQRASANDPANTYAVFERVHSLAGRYIAWFDQGERVERYTLRDGDKVIATATTAEELDIVTEQALKLSLTSDDVTLTDRIEEHPMVFKDGEKLNPKFGPIQREIDKGYDIDI